MTASLPATTTPSGLRSGRSLRERLWDYRWCYVFLAPSLVLMAMFTLYPTVASWVYSTLDWTGFGTNRSFIGLGNYRELAGDLMFWRAFGRSFLFVVVAVPLRMITSLVVAVVLNNQSLRFAPVFRTMFFLPVVTTSAIIGVVMSLLFSPFNGPIDRILSALHMISGPVDFLGDPHLALWTVIAVEVWKGFGITMIYWLAALQTVPRHFYEAAEVDGAGRWAVLRHITVPILLPFAAIIALLTANQTLHVFGLVQAMTAGGPYFATQVMEVYIYQTAFAPAGGSVPRLGYASAAGCVFGVGTMLVALLQVVIARRVVEVRKQLKAVS